MKLRNFVVLVTLLGLSACFGTPQKKVTVVRPAWIDEPGRGVSAAAAFHVRGDQAQEELATSRARDEYAKRYGVVVSSEQATSQLVVGGRVSSISAKDIHEEVKQKEVKATVKAKWKDPETGMLWIWLVPAE